VTTPRSGGGRPLRITDQAAIEEMTTMTMTTTTWRDFPADTLILLLGEQGYGLHPRDIYDPEWLARQFEIPLELLPVSEFVADESRGITIMNAGRPAQCAQAVVAGDLIDAIAAGLGVKRPADARPGYSGSRFDLAAAIVKHLKTA
jgi:hypothetical protein